LSIALAAKKDIFLEECQASHFPKLLATFRDSNSLRFSAHPFPTSCSDLERYILGHRFTLCKVALLHDGAVFGLIGIKSYASDSPLPLLSFQLSPEHRGKGKSAALLQVFFENHPELLSISMGAYVRVGHISSLKTLQRFNFKLQKTVHWGGAPWWFFEKRSGLAQITL